MTGECVLQGRGITHGRTEAKAVVSRSAFGFFGAVDPSTGTVSDRRHELYGETIAGRVLVFPEGRGSTAGAIVMMELARCGTAPAAMVNVVTEPILATGAILAEKFYDTVIPVIDRVEEDPTTAISTGDWVVVDADSGRLTIRKTDSARPPMSDAEAG